MKPEFEKPQMVRGVVVSGTRWSGAVSADNNDCAVAKTHWFRHDDNLNELEAELVLLVKALTRSSKCHGAASYYEYQDYRK